MLNDCIVVWLIKSSGCGNMNHRKLIYLSVKQFTPENKKQRILYPIFMIHFHCCQFLFYTSSSTVYDGNSNIHIILQGTGETVRVVSMDKDFHVDCYVCEVSTTKILPECFRPFLPCPNPIDK